MIQYKIKNNAKEALFTGAHKLADMVKLTLGPKGKLVVIERKHELPIVTQDGVTVAKHFEIEDQYENMGASIMKQVSKNTDKNVGDGTTTATVVAQAILSQIDPLTDTDSVALKNELTEASQTILAKIDEHTKSMTVEAVSDVAYISSLDRNIASMLSEIFTKLGQDAVCGFERTNQTTTAVEINSGMTTNRGYQHQLFINDSKTGEAKIENPYILITDQKIDTIDKLQPVIEQLKRNGTPRLVIVSDDIAPGVLAALVTFNSKGIFKVVAIKSPGYGTWRTEYLMDLALYTGGKFFSSDKADKIEQATLQDLGQCRHVKSNIWSAIFIDGPEKQKELCAKKAEDLKELNKVDPSELRNKQISNLIGGVGMIYVGGATESEIDEVAYKVQDAINAVKSSFELGIVAGGGSTLYTIADELQGGTRGMEIMKKALKGPFEQILANAGIAYNGKLEKGMGIDATKLDCTQVDMFKVGIVDAAKATRNAISNAVSVVNQLINIDGVMINVDKVQQTDEFGMPIPR